MKGIPYALLVATALAATSAAQAQSAWYGGLSVGQSRVKFSEDFLSVPNISSQSISSDDTAGSYKAFVGYRLMKNFGLEGGYTNFGTFSASNSFFSIVGPATLDYQVKVSGANLDAVGILPIGDDFELFGKLGLIYTITKATFTGSGGLVFAPQLIPSNAKHSEVNLKAGIGAEYRLTGKLGLRFEAEQAYKVGDEGTTGEGDIRMVSLGVTYRF